MSNPVETIESALAEIEAARVKLTKGHSVQITQADLRDYLKSVAFSWFRSHRPQINGELSAMGVKAVDIQAHRILDATSRASARTTYVSALREAKAALTALRGEAIFVPDVGAPTFDPAPDFSKLASDATMREILTRRWDECHRCIQVGAHLAATVMMGGMLEALFVARANLLSDKTPLFRAKATPIDGKTKKPLQLREWTLKPYIEVAHELGWITHSAKDVAGVLRDYRNYVHPEKERSNGVVLNSHDSGMFWLVTKSLTSQLLEIRGVT